MPKQRLHYRTYQGKKVCLEAVNLCQINLWFGDLDGLNSEGRMAFAARIQSIMESSSEGDAYDSPGLEDEDLDIIIKEIKSIPSYLENA